VVVYRTILLPQRKAKKGIRPARLAPKPGGLVTTVKLKDGGQLKMFSLSELTITPLYLFQWMYSQVGPVW